MLTQEIVDKISDEFGSTFTLVSPKSMANMLFSKELPKLKSIVKKHVPQVKNFNFRMLENLDWDYYIWLIELSDE